MHVKPSSFLLLGLLQLSAAFLSLGISGVTSLIFLFIRFTLLRMPASVCRFV